MWELLPYGNQVLVLRRKNQVTGFYMTDTLDFKMFLPTGLCALTSIRFIRIVLKSTSDWVSKQNLSAEIY